MTATYDTSVEPLGSASVTTTTGPPRRIGVIDLGSNTARLVVYECRPGRWYRLVDSIREPVRLAQGMAGRLKPAAVERANAALELFADFARGADLDAIEVLATSAVREAENRDEVLSRMAELGLTARILPGSSEAEYGTLAVANSTQFADAWVVDMGGGSVQISRMEDRRFVDGDAYPLGALRLSEAFLGLGEEKRGATTAKQVKRVEKELEKQLGHLARRFADEPGPLVAMGGTVRNLAKVVQRKHSYPLEILHGYRLRRGDLEALTEEILAKPPEELRQVPGLSWDRADLIAAGALVFRWLLRTSERSELVISGQGVREGAFYRLFQPAPHLVDDPRRFAVDNLFALYPQAPRHTRKVIELALLLFDELAPLHGLGAAERETLAAAAKLHDIGMTIGYYRHHRYGSQLLTAAGLPGWEHSEQAMINLLVRYHRKGTPSPSAYPGLLDASHRPRLLALTVCLRLAEHLERSRSGRIQGLRAVVKKQKVVLELRAEHEPTVEMWEANKDGPLFEEAFDRVLVLEYAGGGAGL
ncbi:MAG: Ppx/GppA family phosphatase [Acidobacteria bacterium]|nr:MAG: Ppx/GppA family phosphatase [Acidobacteriota bacterium]REK05904.1 MAG: Ppx/GppA family phosphatase [Acidobacteriota bacterium]